MKKKIIEIATELSKGKLTTKEAKVELLFLFGVSVRYKINGELPTATGVIYKTFDFDEISFLYFKEYSSDIHPDWVFNWDGVESYYSR